MYKELINNEVVIMVSSRAEAILEYTGLLCEENDEVLRLKNVEISQALLNFQKNMFGAGLGSYKQNIEEVILNKRYVISCSKK